MAVRLSYEPSLQAVVHDVLSFRSRVIADPLDLRRRVSWPTVLRATGLGRLEGGELALVPPGRERSVLDQLSRLRDAGLVGLVLTEPVDVDEEAVLHSGVPVVVLPPDADPRKLREDVERYIARRRRELFALDQEIHRTLVEAAIGGARLPELVDVASSRAGKVLALDREGDIVLPPAASPPPDLTLYVQARTAGRDAPGKAVLIPGPPPSLGIVITAGNQRRGVGLLLDAGAERIDDDEAILTGFASAAAIALAREPEPALPSVEDIAAGGGRFQNESLGVTALAVRDPGAGLRRLARAIETEMHARSIQVDVAREDDLIVAVAAVERTFPWTHALRSIARRLPAEGLVAGLGRPYRGADAVERSAREAIQAIHLGGGSDLTRFESVELTSLLRGVPGGNDFAAGRLQPLLAHPDLLETLKTYLRTGRNGTRAAQELRVHRNTLIYRLNRIRDLLQEDPDDPEAAFALELALRLSGESLSEDAGTG